jgi:alkylated DNA repair dioxygenase AlkB
MLFVQPPRKVLQTGETEVVYHSEFLPTVMAEHALHDLMLNAAWRQESMRIYGREAAFPRLTAWYGDPGHSYAFSGLVMHPEPWTPLLTDIKTWVEQLSAETYNSVLLNLYRSGSDSISWHSDDERELGPNPTVASVSFGGSRRFMIRERQTKQVVAEVLLEHNSLLVMRGAMMKLYQHQIPKTSAHVAPRVNLTFRTIRSREE